MNNQQVTYRVPTKIFVFFKFCKKTYPYKNYFVRSATNNTGIHIFIYVFTCLPKSELVIQSLKSANYF